MNDILKNVLSAVLGAAIIAIFGWFFAGVRDFKAAVDTVPILQEDVKKTQGTAEMAKSTAVVAEQSAQQAAAQLTELSKSLASLSRELDGLKPGIVTSAGIKVQLQNTANQAFLDIDGNREVTQQGTHRGLMLILDDKPSGTKWLLKKSD